MMNSIEEFLDCHFGTGLKLLEKDSDLDQVILDLEHSEDKKFDETNSRNASTNGTVLLPPDEVNQFVFNFSAGKTYIEPEPTMSLENIIKLEKRSVEKAGKECLLGDLVCNYSKKLRGRVITTEAPHPDQKPANTFNLSLKKAKCSFLDKKRDDSHLAKLQQDVLEKFTSKSDTCDGKSAQNSSKNFFKVSNCQQCKKKRFVFQSFANYMPLNCQKMFCAECLKDCYQEDINYIIQTRTNWSTPFKRKIAKLPGSLLPQETHPKLEYGNEGDEKVYVIDSFLKVQAKKMLDLNCVLIKKLEKNKKLLSLEEKMLGMKVIHDNLESLVKIKSAIYDNKLRHKLESVDKKSYTGLINDVSNFLKKRRLEERLSKEEEEIMIDKSLFMRAGHSETIDLMIRKRGLSDHHFSVSGNTGEESKELIKTINNIYNLGKRMPFQVQDE
jgi:hypothetical protein